MCYHVYEIVYNDTTTETKIFIENNNVYQDVSFLQYTGFFYITIRWNSMFFEILSKNQIFNTPLCIDKSKIFTIKEIRHYIANIQDKDDVLVNNNVINEKSKIKESLSL